MEEDNDELVDGGLRRKIRWQWREGRYERIRRWWRWQHRRETKIIRRPRSGGPRPPRGCPDLWPSADPAAVAPDQGPGGMLGEKGKGSCCGMGGIPRSSCFPPAPMAEGTSSGWLRRKIVAEKEAEKAVAGGRRGSDAGSGWWAEVLVMNGRRGGDG